MNRNVKKKYRAGLSIIELIIVIAMIAIAIPALFGLFFTMLRARAKLNILQEAKLNGDNALNIMQHRIREAVAIYSAGPSGPGDSAPFTTEVCSTKTLIPLPPAAKNSSMIPGSNLYFKDKDDNFFWFQLLTPSPSEKFIVLYKRIFPGGLTDETELTRVIRLQLSNVELNCNRPGQSTFALPIVTIQFTISNASVATLRQEDKFSLNFSTKVKLRN